MNYLVQGVDVVSRKCLRLLSWDCDRERMSDLLDSAISHRASGITAEVGEEVDPHLWNCAN